MLSAKELSPLLGILDDHTKHFEIQVNNFTRIFTTKSEYFRIATGLYILLQNGVLSLGSRFNAYFILLELYKSDKEQQLTITTNPFLPVFIAPLLKNTCPLVERIFLTCLLSKSKEVQIIPYFFSFLFSSIFSIRDQL